jgi:hypothetical protein
MTTPFRRETGARERRRIERYALFVAVGYLVGWRSFAYVGIPALNLFIGEFSLFLAFVNRRTRQAFHTAVDILLNPGPWHGLVVVITLFLGLGVFEVVRGMVNGYPFLLALKNLPFNYYVILVVLGIWLGHKKARLLERLAWSLAVVNAVYGIPAVLFLTKLTFSIPGSKSVDTGGPTPVFSIGTASGMAILALLAFPLPARWRKWTPVLLVANGFVMFAEQQRAEWLGFALGLLVLCICKRRMRTFLATILAVVGLLAIIGVAGINIPGASGRGGQVSLAGVTGRIIAPVNPTAASQLTGNSNVYAATVNWRTTWWSAIWKSSQQDLPTLSLGHGYGYELRQLAQYVPADTRTPHNVFFYALGYSGWIGVGLFCAVWYCLFGKMYRAFRLTGNPFGLAFAAVAFGLGLFGNWFETPYGAAPTYFVVGLVIGGLGPFSVDAGSGLRGRIRRPSRPISPVTGDATAVEGALVPAVDQFRSPVGTPSIGRGKPASQRRQPISQTSHHVTPGSDPYSAVVGHQVTRSRDVEAHDRTTERERLGHDPPGRIM